MFYIIIIFLLSVLSKGNCDRKAFKEGGVESSNGKGWLMKVPFSFLLGKWHRWDAVRVMSLCIALTLCLNLPIFWALVLYIVHGIIFEILYGIEK